jgi:hypothetical protein
MSFTPQTITIKSPTRTGDTSGGKVPTYASVWTGSACLHLYSSRGQSEMREESGTHNAAGPGVLTVKRNYFAFTPPKLPPAAVARDWHIIDSGGVTWRVLFVRVYGWSTQIDAEVVS